MPRIIKDGTTENTTEGPAVVLSMEEWKRIEKLIDEHEDARRYKEALSADDNQGLTSLAEMKKELNSSADATD